MSEIEPRTSLQQITPGHIAKNIAFFVRALRVAGIPVGPKTMLDAVEAVEAAGIGTREDLYWTLHAVIVTRRDQSVLFDQAFRLFWRRRSLVEKMIQLLSPYSPLQKQSNEPKPLSRVADALFGQVREQEIKDKPKIEVDATMTAADIEVFRSKDFEQMTASEITDAKQEIARLVLPLDKVVTRRFMPDPRGSILDPRRTLRASMRGGGAGITLQYRSRQMKRPPIVALCDISGSMGDYSRIFLHFLHALSKSGRKVHSFVFATELTNVTRLLKGNKDPEIALAECGKTVRDWDGGTRISDTVESFNKRWARRVLSGGAIVLFISDGLERRLSDDLNREMARLHRSSRRLIWLNPLLRYDAFEAKASGIVALLPHVDEFRPIHSLHSMKALCKALSRDGCREADPRRWLSQPMRRGLKVA
jgi:uncharacterized protein